MNGVTLLFNEETVAHRPAILAYLGGRPQIRADFNIGETSTHLSMPKDYTLEDVYSSLEAAIAKSGAPLGIEKAAAAAQGHCPRYSSDAALKIVADKNPQPYSPRM